MVWKLCGIVILEYIECGKLQTWITKMDISLNIPYSSIFYTLQDYSSLAPHSYNRDYGYL
jgi:hypothetical protein